MEISGKKVLITGAGSGLGKASYDYLTQLGADCIGLDLNNSDYEINITDENRVSDLFDQLKSNNNLPQILINCAGIAPAQKITGKKGLMPLESFKQVIDVNLIGSFNTMRLFAHNLAQESNTQGLIINTASIAAFEGQIGQTAYSASKAGIVGMTLPAARELAPLGIRVMTIAPGIFKTAMLESMSDTVQQSLAAMIPYPNRLGEPMEFAKLAAHIIENDMLNGEVIRLDGAIRMQAK